MTVADEIPRSWTLSSIGLLIGIVAAPPAICLWASAATWRPLVAGAVIWLVSVLLKWALFDALKRVISTRPKTVTATVQGVLSAIAELGAVAPYFAWAHGLSLLEVASVGIGAGCAEAAYVLAVGIVGARPSDDILRAWMHGARQSYCVRFMVPVERLFALVGHTGARGLIYVGLHAPWAIAAPSVAAAVLIFALIDGVAVYGHLSHWNWFAPSTCRQAHTFFATMAVLEVAVFTFAFSIGMRDI